jgi:hypothetical protein
MDTVFFPTTSRLLDGVDERRDQLEQAQLKSCWFLHLVQHQLMLQLQEKDILGTRFSTGPPSTRVHRWEDIPFAANAHESFHILLPWRSLERHQTVLLRTCVRKAWRARHILAENLEGGRLPFLVEFEKTCASSPASKEGRTYVDLGSSHP